jgi:glycosyltransferase involved in cell wall biosynthesis
MKIAVNSRIYMSQKGGIPYYIKLLYGELARTNPKEQILFLQPSSEVELGETRTLPALSIGRIKYLFDLVWVHVVLSREKSVDVMHGPANILPILKKKGVRYVVTIHDLAFILYPEHNSWAFNFYYRWAVRWSISRADVVIATSKNTKNDLTRFYKINPNKIKVVYLGINRAYLNPPKMEKLIEGKYIFSVSTHPRRKNTTSVIKALRGAEWFKSYSYVIAGVMADDQRKQLEKLVCELGFEKQVIFFGYATEEQLSSLYAHADFFIYPSFYEGFGMPVLEAMACRCPVITSNTSSLVELLPEQKWLVEPSSVTSIASRMEQLARLPANERTRLAEQNYNFAKQFTWERTAQSTREAFLREI